jgi:peptidoglycan/xylan/chitin deacetylase (PgdA/CDA1 family)
MKINKEESKRFRKTDYKWKKGKLIVVELAAGLLMFSLICFVKGHAHNINESNDLGSGYDINVEDNNFDDENALAFAATIKPTTAPTPTVKPKPTIKPTPTLTPTPTPVAEDKDIKGVVALTFDDGPSDETTLEILDILEETDSTATFFVLGSNAKQFPDIVEEVYDAGNEIGLHSMGHETFPDLTEKERESNLEKERKIIYKITGENPTLFRPPGGNYNNEMKKYLDYPIIYWAKDSNDWRGISDTKVMNNVLKNLKAGDIILFHDTKPRTLKLIKKIILKIQKMGFELKSVSETAEYYGKELEDGVVYTTGAVVKTKK